MAPRPIRVGVLVLTMLWLTGCADQLVALRYTPDPEIQKIAGTQAMTVFRFVDARGDEGDHGDPTRVGGTYGGYGNRLSKVRASTPWAEALMQGLTVGLARRGVQAVTVDRVYAAGSQPVSTPLILAGEIRNFSTEQRWTLQSHISGIIRLYDSQGTLLLEKPISARTRIIDTDSRASDSSAPLEVLLNETLQKFVRAVVTDPELTQRLCFAAGWDKTTYTVAQPGSLLTPPGPAPKTVDLSRFLGPDWVYTTLSVAQSGLPLTRPTSALAGVESRDSIGRAAAAGQLR